MLPPKIAWKRPFKQQLKQKPQNTRPREAIVQSKTVLNVEEPHEAEVAKFRKVCTQATMRPKAS